MSTPKRYAVNDVFYSVQGEGFRAGTANVFVRFTGCNLACDVEPGPESPGGFACDTEFRSGVARTGEELLGTVSNVLAACNRAPDSRVGVIFTGGEPGLQLDDDLLLLFARDGFGTLAVETNGTVDLAPMLDRVTAHVPNVETYVAMSPKVAEHAVKMRRVDELRYVRAEGQGIPQCKATAEHYYLSPAFNGDEPDPRAVRWCVDLVKRHPEWRLSVQAHKLWNVR